VVKIKTKEQVILEVKELIKAGDSKQAFRILNSVSSATDDFVLQIRYCNILKKLSREALGLRKIRLALLASSTVSHFKDILLYWLAKEGIDAELYEAEYNSIHQVILDPHSRLYDFKPEVVFIFTNYRDINCKVYLGMEFEEVRNAVLKQVNELVALWKVLQKNCNCSIIQNNADLPYPRMWGNYEGAALYGCLNVLRIFNLELAKAIIPAVTIFDLEHISSIYGKQRWHDSRYWYYAKYAFAPDASGLVAHAISKVICAINGASKKCIIFDLDNTIWGGLIGDDGMNGIVLGNGPDGEAYVDFQRFLLQLKSRGILLAVCSKNDEDSAKEPFLRHPEMQLKLEDIVAFKANWDDKASNIREIAEELNIGLDSVVFVDDSPAERELVREILPMVNVPEMPSDPAEYIPSLSSHSYFEAIAFSAEDSSRSDYYRDNVARCELKKESVSLEEYLKNLNMEMTVGTLDNFNLTRISQLINKSNQFHLTTTRYDEGEIKSMIANTNRTILYFRLKDRFGDNGLIAAVILDKNTQDSLFIDTWVMSCRVLSRGVEEFICSEIIALAQASGITKIIGKYIPTQKNKLVAQLYPRLYFKLVKEDNGTTLWELDLKNNKPAYRTFINKV
jgi:FkbH-like protein